MSKHFAPRASPAWRWPECLRAVFAPPYDATLDQKTTSAYESVAKLAAHAEMGFYQDKATYPGAVDTYATIQGALAVVAVRAASAPVAGKRAEDARDQTVGFIKGCSAQVSGLAALTRTMASFPARGPPPP